MKFRILAVAFLAAVVRVTTADDTARKTGGSKSQQSTPSPSPEDGCPSDDVILAWNRIALDCNVRDHNGPEISGNLLSATMGPPKSAVQLAKVHAAMFDAYNSIAKEYEPGYMSVDDDYYTTGASIEAAVTVAAYQSLVLSFPYQMDILTVNREAWLDSIPDGDAKFKGIQVGMMCASAVAMARYQDGSTVPMTYDWPGPHQPDPNHPDQNVISPQAGNIVPFLMDRFIEAPPPPNMDTKAYADAYNQVKMLGGDNTTTPTTRTLAESVVGWYWSYNGSPKLGTPPRLCNEIARVVACQMQNNVGENARLFALINLGLADAGISAWRTKFTYNWWRPIVGIRNGDSDGNDETVGDPNWNYLGASRSNPVEVDESNFTPAFPSYTSGHATFCGFAFKMLANFYGSNQIEVTFKSQEFDGLTRDDKGFRRPCLIQSFPALSLMSAQCAASRVWNGVHWAYDGVEGVKVGNEIADNLFENKLLPLSGNNPNAVWNQDVDEEIKAVLNRTVTVDIKLCQQKKKDLQAVLWTYFSKYQNAG